MTDWLLVLMVLSVAAVLSCFRFVGCTLPLEGLPAGYPKIIGSETSLLAYWRLGEPLTTKVGDAAKDEIGVTPVTPTGAHHGTYQKILLDAVPASQSPATENPPILNAGLQPGLLLTDPSAPSVQVNGGFVSVPFDSTFNPTDKPFSVEAWVNPEWDVNEKKVFRCVVASRQDTGDGLPKFGYMIYAGPSTLDLMKQDDQMYWQAWVGDGTDWVRLVMDEPLKREPTYLLLTWDGATTITLDVFPVSATASTRKPNDKAAYKPVNDTTIPLLIGMGTPDFSPLHYPFRGRLQEIAFYNEALQQGQVTAHVQAAKGA